MYLYQSGINDLKSTTGFVCIYIYIYIYTHIDIHVHIYKNTNITTHIYAHTHAHTHIFTPPHAPMRTPPPHTHTTPHPHSQSDLGMSVLLLLNESFHLHQQRLDAEHVLTASSAVRLHPLLPTTGLGGFLVRESLARGPTCKLWACNNT